MIFDREAAKPETRQYLSSPLTYHNQTWYIDPRHHHGDTQWIWWTLTSIINKEVFLLLSRHMSIFRTNFLCLLILSNRPILLTKYFPLEHQKLVAMFRVVKINITYPKVTDYVQSSKFALYDLQTKPNKPAQQLFLIQNRLAVTANQTWRQSCQTGSKPVISNSLTYHSQTC